MHHQYLNMDIINGYVPGYQGLQQIEIRRGFIETIRPVEERAIAPPENPSYPQLNVNGDWISLGGVDLQINGALGLAFPDLTPDHTGQLLNIGKALYVQGVDGYLPTLVTTAVERIHQSMAVIATVMEKQVIDAQTPAGHGAHIYSLQSGGAQILGVHLEGPFLNVEKRGAHPAEHLQPLTLDRVKTLLGDYASIVKVMTLAPELDPTNEVIPYLRSLGITVSLGHSLATAAQAHQAFDLGASMVTHAFNAMPPLHHREPGLLGAAIAHPDVACGFIADGQHVCPMMLDIVLRASQYDKGMFLVSDALAPLGLADGVYPWDSRQISVVNGTARLADGTLAGTTLTLLDGVKNLVKWKICEPEKAIALATTAPRQAIGLMDSPQSYSGQPADLLRWHHDPVAHTFDWTPINPSSRFL